MDKTARQLADATGEVRALLFGAALGLVNRLAGGSDVLGISAERAIRAYRESLVGDAQPGVWIEVPLAGEPGFDMNTFYRRSQLKAGDRFICGDVLGYQPVIDWLADAPQGGFGVGLAHDLRGNEIGHGAYVNPNGVGGDCRDAFFSALGEADAGERSARVVARQPQEWQVMEEGVFADRAGRPARIACRVGEKLQRAYAAEASLLEAHLQQVGFCVADEGMLTCLREMAQSPFELWLEFDVLEDGSVGDSLGADLTFGGSVLGGRRTGFDESSPFARAMDALEARGLADGRWRHLARATMSRLVPVSGGDEGPTLVLVSSEPTFVKAKWIPGETPIAKIYQSCDAKLLGLSH